MKWRCFVTRPARIQPVRCRVTGWILRRQSALRCLPCDVPSRFGNGTPRRGRGVNSRFLKPPSEGLPPAPAKEEPPWTRAFSAGCGGSEAIAILLGSFALAVFVVSNRPWVDKCSVSWTVCNAARDPGVRDRRSAPFSVTDALAIMNGVLFGSNLGLGRQCDRARACRDDRLRRRAADFGCIRRAQERRTPAALGASFQDRFRRCS